MDDRVAELEETDYSSSGWIGKFRELKDRVEHHLEEEEHEVFQMGGKTLSEQDKTALAERFREEKAAEMG